VGTTGATPGYIYEYIRSRIREQYIYIASNTNTGYTGYSPPSPPPPSSVGS
jgi:hypothetical protein